MAREIYYETLSRAVVQASTLGATSAGTTAVDLGTCRKGLLLISLTVGTDVPTNVVIQHSSDNVTFSTLRAVANADVAATGFHVYQQTRIYRYVRATWTRAAAAADSRWSVVVVGDQAVRDQPT